MVGVHSGGCHQLRAPEILEREGAGSLGKCDSYHLVILGHRQETRCQESSGRAPAGEQGPEGGPSAGQPRDLVSFWSIGPAKISEKREEGSPAGF